MQKRGYAFYLELSNPGGLLYRQSGDVTGRAEEETDSGS